jgi:hypothetical protein
MSDAFSVTGYVVNLHARTIRPATVHVADGAIDRVDGTFSPRAVGRIVARAGQTDSDGRRR